MKMKEGHLCCYGGLDARERRSCPQEHCFLCCYGRLDAVILGFGGSMQAESGAKRSRYRRWELPVRTCFFFVVFSVVGQIYVLWFSKMATAM